MARDSVLLRPLEVTDAASVSSVVLEPSVVDATGRPVNGLRAEDFVVLEDGVPQAIDLAVPDQVPATYTLLVDASQSMARRMDFVRDAARQLPTHLRTDDRVIVAPFTKTLGAVTGPTSDRDTIVGAIERIEAKGGTAILNSLVSAAEQLRAIDSRHILVLITDGYDENSDVAFERALDAVKSSQGHGVCDCDRRHRRRVAEGRDAAQASGRGNGRPGVLSGARVPVERRPRPDRGRRAAAVRPHVHAEEPGAGRHLARDYGEDVHAHARRARASRATSRRRRRPSARRSS